MQFHNEKDPLLAERALQIVQRLHAAGYLAYYAGGCVRDALRGAFVKDIDIATNATPDEVAHLFPAQSVGVGKSFGVMLVVLDGVAYDVATFRTDGGYQDGRHPTAIQFDTAEHDAQRRDFTVNALFYDPITETLLDYVEGERDVKAGIVRAVGNARQRFQEDRLRMLRAIRFATTCQWQIAPETWTALLQEASAITCVSQERITTEFSRTLCEAASPSAALNLFYESQLLQAFFPELCLLRGCQQDPQWHPEGDVWQHTLRMLELLPAPRDPLLVWSILLHDIGKPNTLQVGVKPDGSPWYRTPGHAHVGAAMANEILTRFKLPRATIETVTTAVRHHMHFIEFPKMRTSTKRLMLARPSIDLELALHRLDCLSSHAKLDIYEQVTHALEQFQNEPVLPPAVITGKLLIALGYHPGPAMGNRLKDYYTRQLEGASSEELYRLVLSHAPGGTPQKPVKIAFLYGPQAPFKLRDCWEKLCQHPHFDVTLIVEAGVPWTEPYNPQRKLLRQATTCAGEPEPIDLTPFSLILSTPTATPS